MATFLSSLMIRAVSFVCLPSFSIWMIDTRLDSVYRDIWGKYKCAFMQVYWERFVKFLVYSNCLSSTFGSTFRWIFRSTFKSTFRSIYGNFSELFCGSIARSHFLSVFRCNLPTYFRCDFIKWTNFSFQLTSYGSNKSFTRSIPFEIFSWAAKNYRKL